MSNKQEQQWIHNIIDDISWPTPSANLHDHIITNISGTPEVHNTIHVKKVCACALVVFIGAFCLGLMSQKPQNYTHTNTYASSYYGTSSYILNVIGA